MVTAFANRYRFDAFFRTEINIIALQGVFAFSIGVLMWVSFTYFFDDIEAIITAATVDRAAPRGISPTGEAIVGQLEELRTKSLLLVAALLMGMTVLFGYIIARVTLVPARNSLAAQKQFIGNIAHELRTPLSIIKTNTEVSMLDEDLDPKVTKTLRSNIEELDRISDIINNLLSFSAFVRPERMEFGNVDLGKVVDTITGKLSRLAERKQIEFIVRKGDFRIVRGNATALEQIVMNILENAIRYTGSGGTIKVTVEPNYHNFIDLIIEDSGVGIARKDLFRIFEPFYRAEHARTRRYGGSGLGLAIVNELVKIHNGKIIIRSAPGKGTTVLASFPRGKTEREAREEKASAIDEITVDFSRKTG